MDSNFTNVTKRPLTRKQKLLWGAVILVVFLYFNPSILRPVFGAFTSGGQHKPSPMVPAVTTPTAAQVAAASAATMTYKTDRIVSHGQGKCDMESMDVTPFGSGQVAAQWKDNCGGGEMTLAKIN